MHPFSYLGNAGDAYVAQLYQEYQRDPAAVPDDWRRFFEGFDLAAQYQPGAASTNEVDRELDVLDLINAYRHRGHLYAAINPILPRTPQKETLDLRNFSLTDADLDKTFQGGAHIGIGAATLRQIVQHLQETYCRAVGAEYKHIRQPECIKWLEERMDGCLNRPRFSKEERPHLLRKVGEANSFESFLHRKFVGQKRFSLEGAEALIPCLDACVEQGAIGGVQEFVFGMAHRGRLNVLVNILRKEYDNVFSEFSGRFLSNDLFDGDVKYHLGFSADLLTTTGRPVHLSLMPNPSHLEAVNPVVAGVTRAKMDNVYDGDPRRICPILIHGDASLAGQGVVYEVIQMSGLHGYQTGGTVHIVVNNQVGFTTDPRDSRTSTYCTDIAKVTLSPVFHVNGDDPEAVAYVTRLAMDYRQAFGTDVFVDILCYRKYGHNEGDEPRYTNPHMYDAIAKHPSPLEVYSRRLIAEGVISEADVQQLNTELQAHLNKELEESKVVTYALGEKPRRAGTVSNITTTTSWNPTPTPKSPRTRSAGWPSPSRPCPKASTCTATSPA